MRSNTRPSPSRASRPRILFAGLDSRQVLLLGAGSLFVILFSGCPQDSPGARPQDISERVAKVIGQTANEFVDALDKAAKQGTLKELIEDISASTTDTAAVGGTGGMASTGSAPDPTGELKEMVANFAEGLEDNLSTFVFSAETEIDNNHGEKTFAVNVEAICKELVGVSGSGRTPAAGSGAEGDIVVPKTSEEERAMPEVDALDKSAELKSCIEAWTALNARIVVRGMSELTLLLGDTEGGMGVWVANLTAEDGRLELKINLEQLLEAGKELLAVAGRDASDLPSTLTGILVAEIVKKKVDGAWAVHLANESKVTLAMTIDGGPVNLQLPPSALQVDLDQTSVSAAIGVGAAQIAIAAKLLYGDDWMGTAKQQLRLKLGGLSSVITHDTNDGLLFEDFCLCRWTIGTKWDTKPTQLLLDDQVLASIDLRNDTNANGTPSTIAIKSLADRLMVGFLPKLTADVGLSFGLIKDLLPEPGPSWALSDQLQILFSATDDKPSLELADVGDALLKVVSGTLTVSSSIHKSELVIDAEQCMTEVPSSEPADSFAQMFEAQSCAP